MEFRNTTSTLMHKMRAIRLFGMGCSGELEELLKYICLVFDGGHMLETLQSKARSLCFRWQRMTYRRYSSPSPSIHRGMLYFYLHAKGEGTTRKRNGQERIVASSLSTFLCGEA